MTTDDRRRAWLEREMRATPDKCRRCDVLQDDTPTNYCADGRVHMWSTDYAAFAALLDAPMRELEEALDDFCTSYRDAPMAVARRALAALARLPWREEKK